MTSLPFEVTFAPEVEALQVFLWYENIKDGLGEDFKESIDLKIKLLHQNPKAYSFIYKDIRSVKIKTFPFNLIYRVFDEKPQIIVYFITQEILKSEEKEYKK